LIIIYAGVCGMFVVCVATTTPSIDHAIELEVQFTVYVWNPDAKFAAAGSVYVLRFVVSQFVNQMLPGVLPQNSMSISVWELLMNEKNAESLPLSTEPAAVEVAAVEDMRMTT